MSSGLVVWFTGLSGSGKTTIAQLAGELLSIRGWNVDIVDGDDLRRSVATHLGFSQGDVAESNRVAIEICSKRAQGCDVLLVPRISPTEEGRSIARQAFQQAYLEVYVKAQIGTLEDRDPKGLYARSRKGEMEALIGMPGGLPFDVPNYPDLVLDTDAMLVDSLAESLVSFIEERISLGK